MDYEKVKGESEITSYMYAKASKAKIPLGGTFELSPICNFSCKMCYIRKTKKEVEAWNRPMMTCDQWLALAKELKTEGMLYLLLTGGEPLLWPDFWRLYEELSKMGFLISINTNGSLINEETVERFKRMPPTRINLTIYGASDESYEALCGVKGVFSKVDYAINQLKEAGISLKLNCSLTPENAGDLEQMVAYAKEKDLLIEVATYMFPPLRRDESLIGTNERFTPEEAAYYNLKRFRLQREEQVYWRYLENVLAKIVPPPGLAEGCVDPKDGRIRCRAGKASFWITWDGWLTPCGMMNEPKVDVTMKSFRENWKMLTSLTEAVATSSVCDTCSNKRVCHSCAAMALAETGNASGIPRYLCEEMNAVYALAKEELASKDKKGGKK